MLGLTTSSNGADWRRSRNRRWIDPGRVRNCPPLRDNSLSAGQTHDAQTAIIGKSRLKPLVNKLSRRAGHFDECGDLVADVADGTGNPLRPDLVQQPALADQGQLVIVVWNLDVARRLAEPSQLSSEVSNLLIQFGNDGT